jgi:hypothetical protein
MSKAKKKPASKLTTDEVVDRIFGKGAAQKLRDLLDLEDEQKGRKKGRKRRDDDDDD